MKGLIFTYALTYGGAVLSLVNPFYGLLIYICFAIVKPPALWHWSVPAGNYSRIIGIAFLLGWAMHGFGDGRLGRARPIVLSLLGYFCWVTLSTLASPEPERGLPFVEYLAKVVLPFVAGVTLIRTWTQLWQLFWVILGSCAYLAYEANLAYFNGVSVEQEGLIQLDNNAFSILMATSFGLALVLSFEDEIVWRRYLCFGIAAAMAHVPMLAFSRGGMLATLVSAIVAVAVAVKTPRTWLLILIGFLVASFLVGPSVVDEFSTSFAKAEERDASAQSRIDLWQDCFDAMLNRPILGVGTEHWDIVVESYGWPPGKEAHSLWLQTAAELGVPGITFLLSFYCLVIVLTWKAGRETNVPAMAMLSRMMLVSLSGFMVAASFVTVEGYELPYYVALMGACGLKITYSEVSELAEFAWIPATKTTSSPYCAFAAHRV